MNVPQRLAICAALCAAAGPLPLGAAPTGNVHLTYHWHLHQPIYWPERNPNGAQTNRYQFAADSIAPTVAGRRECGNAVAVAVRSATQTSR